MKNANLQLIKANPDIDLFIYPKYNIQRWINIFSNKSIVNINATDTQCKNLLIVFLSFFMLSQDFITNGV